MHWASSLKWSLCSLCFPLYSYFLFIEELRLLMSGLLFLACLVARARSLSLPNAASAPAQRAAAANLCRPPPVLHPSVASPVDQAMLSLFRW